MGSLSPVAVSERRRRGRTKEARGFEVSGFGGWLVVAEEEASKQKGESSRAVSTKIRGPKV